MELILFPTPIVKQNRINEYKQFLIEINKKEVDCLKLDDKNTLDTLEILRGKYKACIFLTENNIRYEYEKQDRSFKIGKFIFFMDTNRWRVEGKDKYYYSRGIEDFIERFYRGNK